MKKTMLGAAPVAAVLAIAGCGGGGYGSGAAVSSAPASANAAASAAASVALGHSKLGSFLADGSGRALYLFEADKGSVSSCYSACASLWPPLRSAAAVKPAIGVSPALLGTTKRHDGTAEVTYRGHPLYYYAGDSKSGDTTGQALNQFGAKWYLVAANGNKIDTDGQ